MNVLPHLAARHSLLAAPLRTLPRRTLLFASPAFPRSYSQFVPPQQLRDLKKKVNKKDEDQNDEDNPLVLPPPDSPSFYTTRSGYYDNLLQLEKAVGQVHAALKSIHLLPLPDFARKSLPPKQQIYWKPKIEMGNYLSYKLTIARYNKLIAVLNKLNEYHNIASAAGVNQLAETIMEMMNMFINQGAQSARSSPRKMPTLDQYGRSYSVGRRKTSSARVWMIPVRAAEPTSIPDADSPEALLGLDPIAPANPPIPVSTILINNIPLNDYFPLSTDRERVMYPFKVAGMIGKYNVFALTRGGGTTGQSGAIAVGVAKGLVAHNPDISKLFMRMKLVLRDPRVVERKKTNRPKARKAYSWVKR